MENIKEYSFIIQLISTILCVLLGFFLTRKKYILEIVKLKLEITKLETADKSAMAKISEISEKISKEKKVIIYGESLPCQADFGFACGYNKNQNESILGNGDFEVIDGVVSINNKSEKGKIELELLKYYIDGRELDYMPANKKIEQTRKIQVYMEAKSSEKNHIIHVNIRNNDPIDTSIEEQKLLIKNSEYRLFECVFRVAVNRDIVIRLDDYCEGTTPSSVEIKNLKVYEIL